MLKRLKRAVSELSRIKDRPENVASGFGIGMGLGVSPFWGLLTPVCVFCCWLFRGNQVAGMLAMWAVAPLFYVVVFPLEIWAGSLILGGEPAYAIVGELLKTRDWSQLLTLGKGWVVGFFPVGLLFGLLCWALALGLLRRFRSMPVLEPAVVPVEVKASAPGTLPGRESDRPIP